MIDVLKTTKFVTENADHVEIDLGGLENLVKKITEKELNVSEMQLVKYEWELNDLIQLITLTNVVCFCFWAEKDQVKWIVNIEGEVLDGAIAQFRAFEYALKHDRKLLDATYLSKMSRNNLAKILDGNVEIPMFDERLKLIRSYGKDLLEHFGGDFFKYYDSCDGDGFKLLEVLIENFESFDDTSMYKGKEIGFYKRAQLNSKMLSDAREMIGESPLTNIDKLTGFADYKVPQILRKVGVLKYSRSLAKKIDYYELIPAGSDEEVEIRAVCIQAQEIIKKKLKPNFPNITSAHIDTMLWTMSQQKLPDDKPYHRTYTTAY